MQSPGQGNEKNSYRVILLLVVGLAAFSSAMKELNQVHELTLETSRLLAQWSDVVLPARQTPMLAKVETCQKSTIALPLPPPPPAPEVPAVEPADEAVAPAPVPPAPPKVREPRIIKSQRAMRTTPDAAELRVLILKSLNRSINLRSAS
jgi:hypothetical protein